MRLLAVFVFGAVCAFSQPFGAGVKLGVPFTDFVDKASSGTLSDFSHPKRYIFGLSGELRLPFGLGVEVDALYRRMGPRVRASVRFPAASTFNLTIDAARIAIRATISNV
jgi:hypothetical protein